MQQFLHTRRLGIGLAFMVLALDAGTKNLVLENVLHLPVHVVDGFFSIILAWNTGVAFSFLSDISGAYVQWGLVAFALVVASIFVWMLGQSTRWMHQVGIGLIIGGAVGNVLDRLQHGAVVDFLLFYWDTWYFPAFNVADSAISLGVALLLVDHVRKQRVHK